MGDAQCDDLPVESTAEAPIGDKNSVDWVQIALQMTKITVLPVVN